MKNVLFLLVFFVVFSVGLGFQKVSSDGTLSDQKYQDFFPLPLNHFVGGTSSNLHLSLQLSCLKKEHLQPNSTFDPFWFSYCDFLDFFPLKHQQIEVFYTSELVGKVIDYFVARIKTISRYLDHDHVWYFFHSCFKILSQSSFPALQDVGNIMLNSFLGNVLIQSDISLEEIQEVFQKEKKVVKKSDFESLGHFSPLPYLDDSPGEYFAIGDFLFGSFPRCEGLACEGLWILKKGDSHRSPFLRIKSEKSPILTLQNFDYEAVIFRNHSLYYTFPVQMKEGNFVLLQYELKKDGNWKAFSCFEIQEKCSSETVCSFQKQKKDISSCQDLGLTLTTVLNDKK